jgi:hypothetical protein
MAEYGANNFDGSSDGSDLISYKRMLSEAQRQQVELLEIIKKLVDEYSSLAEESEIRQIADSKRIEELLVQSK